MVHKTLITPEHHTTVRPFFQTKMASMTPNSAGPLLVGMGNPLLDISSNVGEDVFDKYGVLPGNAILAEEKHQPLYAELVDKYEVDYIAGGATQNSIRVAQWMLGDSMPGASAYIGCIGKGDAFGASLKSAAEGAGVKCLYMESEEAPTGTCAVLIKEARLIVANLAAAEKFRSHTSETPEVKAAVDSAQFFYMASFFLTHSTESAELVGKHVSSRVKIFCVNLAAPFLIDFFGAAVDKIMPHVDYLFGNETEAAALAKAKDWKNADGSYVNAAECARRAARFPKANGSRPRVVCFTQGKDSTVLACNETVTVFPVEPLPREKLVDTNGAGDAFVGGFLSQLVQGKDHAACVEAGHYAARVIIQRSGCTYPATPDFN